MTTPRLLPLLVLLASAAFAQYTEVPATVDPGRFRFEVDALSLIVDREGPEKFTGVGAGSILLTTGLTPTWDVQLGVEVFISQRFESGDFTERRAGTGDVYLRTKWNFYSSDHLSAAILPFVKVPTNTKDVGNDAVEGGVILPWETYIFGVLTLNSMVELDLVRNEADDGYDTLFYASSAVSKELTRFLSVYAELDATKAAGGSPWQTTLGVGAYITVSDHLSWDLVVYRGLNREAPDWNPVVRVNYGF